MDDLLMSLRRQWPDRLSGFRSRRPSRQIVVGSSHVLEARVYMELTEVERLVLYAMHMVKCECGAKQKSVVTLRYALLWTATWSDGIEIALCNRGNEEPLVAEYYKALCRLVRETPFADGIGSNLDPPSGPRYTECWIT